MKTLTLTVAALALCVPAGSAAPAPAADRYEIDPAHSFALFKVKHLGVGYAWGRVNGPAGAIQLDEADVAKSSVTVELKADAVDTGDAKRDQHLKSPDFFNAKQFPTITFKSTSVKKSGDVGIEVAGDFTLLGVTKAVTVVLARVGGGKDPWGGTRVGYEGAFAIKRSDYGMKYGLEGIGDDVHIIIAVEAVKK
jgi:polyisoprenoid-binding protein YceI